MLQYPAKSYLDFCQNHGLLQIKDRPQWRTVVGGSIEYVKKLSKSFQHKIQLNHQVRRVQRFEDHVIIEDNKGKQTTFDQVVFACHSDQSLKLLADANETEQQLLQAFPYQRNRAILHSDTSLMPKRQAAWAAWNYLYTDNPDEGLTVTYWMNKLQPLNTSKPYFVTLNPQNEPKAGTIHRSFLFDHPCFDKHSYKNQAKLWSLQGKNRTWFCGAYFGFGFHEDGLQSGLAVAEQLGSVSRPWQLAQANSRIQVCDE